MIFRVTHVDEHGHRRKGKVTAINFDHCIAQVEQEWGPARMLSAIVLRTKPVLHLVPSKASERAQRGVYG